MKEKIKMSSPIEMSVRKAMQVFGIAVIALTYLWGIANAVLIALNIVDAGEVPFLIRLLFYLFTIVSLGLLIPIVVYEAKRIRTSSKESIINFAVLLIASLTILVFSSREFVTILQCVSRSEFGAVRPEYAFIVMWSILLVISYNSVSMKKTHLSDSQKASQSITTCFAILLGLMIIPVVFGMFQYWINEGTRDAFDECIFYMVTTSFQLLCIALIIKVVIASIGKQGKQIILWSVMLGFAVMSTIFTIRYKNNVFKWFVEHQNVYTLIVSSLYMITTSILFLCLNKNERQITK